MNMKIQTVKGIKDVSSLSIVDSHVHIWTKKGEGQNEYSGPKVSDFVLIKSCIEDFKKKGGSIIIDCTPQECGRDGNKLYDISDETGIEVVCVTGFHLRQYYSSNSKIWNLNIDEALILFIEEIQNGLRETLDKKRKVKPGIIKIPFTGSLEGAYETLTNAAIQACLITDAPLFVHTERGINVEWFARYLEKMGVRPQKVVFCHIDKRNDINLHKELAERGYYLGYDTFLREKYEPEKNVYRLMDSIIEGGFKNSIMIGTDIYENAMWESVRPSVGYGGIFKKLKRYLSEKFEDTDVEINLMGGNAVRFLSKN